MSRMPFRFKAFTRPNYYRTRHYPMNNAVGNMTSVGGVSLSPHTNQAIGGGSPTNTNIPYLGSKISLISKAKIRYEGILYTIDPQQSTVALAKVRSYGTEDRLVDTPLPPKDEIYEYIIFRATDIEDLQVSEPPRPTSLHEALPHMDPAIVQHAPPTYSNQSSHTMGPLLAQPNVSRSSISYHQHQPAMSDRSAMLGPPHNRNEIAVNTFRNNSFNRPHQDMDGGPNMRVPQFDNRRRVRTVAPPNIFRQNGYQQPRNSGPPMQQESGYYYRYQDRSSSFGMQSPFNRSNRMRNRSIGGGTLKFDGDFDFEKANAEFSKLEKKFDGLTVQENNSPPIAAKPKEPAKSASPETLATSEDNTEKSLPNISKDTSGERTESDEEPRFYDKKKSFFDKISCEALEREKGKESSIRRSWQEERHQNAETFGTFNGNIRYSNRFGGIGGVRTMPRQGQYGGGPRRFGGGYGGNNQNGSYGQGRYLYSGGYGPGSSGSNQGMMGNNRRQQYYPQQSRYYQGSNNGRSNNDLPAWYYEMPPPQVPTVYNQQQQRYGPNASEGYGGSTYIPGNRRLSSDYRAPPITGSAAGNNYSRRYPVYG